MQVNKIYFREIATQTESTTDWYFCFEYLSLLYDYGGNTDTQFVYVPILKEIYQDEKEYKRWLSLPCSYNKELDTTKRIVRKINEKCFLYLEEYMDMLLVDLNRDIDKIAEYKEVKVFPEQPNDYEYIFPDSKYIFPDSN